MMKLVRAVSYLVTLIVVLLVAGTVVPRPFSASQERGRPEHRILVLTNPIHTDIAIPIGPRMRERFALLGKNGVPLDLPGARYLIFGWGSRSFYTATPTWSDLKPGPVFAALTWDQSVMHVSVAGALDEASVPLRDFHLSGAEFDRLLAFVDRSFRKDAGEPILIENAAYGDHDEFFEAHGHFTALLGCNTWASAALREAGLRTGWWNPLPQTLGLSLDIFN